MKAKDLRSVEAASEEQQMIAAIRAGMKRGAIKEEGKACEAALKKLGQINRAKSPGFGSWSAS